MYIANNDYYTYNLYCIPATCLICIFIQFIVRTKVACIHIKLAIISYHLGNSFGHRQFGMVGDSDFKILFFIRIFPYLLEIVLH